MHFYFHPYELRGEIEAILDVKKKWLLTTGRNIFQYNNAVQTKVSDKLTKKYSENIVFVNEIHKDEISEFIILKSKHGKSSKLKVKFTNSVRPYTLYTTFHFAKSNINYLFGDESDKKVKTARFKSIEVEIVNI